MRLTINGKLHDIDTDGSSSRPLRDVLQRLDVNPRLVAVAINGDVIPKTEYTCARVREGDALEIVRMVGGGAR